MALSNWNSPSNSSWIHVAITKKVNILCVYCDMRMYHSIKSVKFLHSCLRLSSVTLSSQTGSRLAVVLTEARPAPFPISIEPSMGTIEPGQMQNFNIHFSPVEVAQYQCRLVCRYSNEEFCCEKKNWKPVLKWRKVWVFWRSNTVCSSSSFSSHCCCCCCYFAKAGNLLFLANHKEGFITIICSFKMLVFRASPTNLERTYCFVICIIKGSNILKIWLNLVKTPEIANS